MSGMFTIYILNKNRLICGNKFWIITNIYALRNTIYQIQGINRTLRANQGQEAFAFLSKKWSNILFYEPINKKSHEYSS